MDGCVLEAIYITITNCQWKNSLLHSPEKALSKPCFLLSHKLVFGS
jgi:hypothetical protein